MCGQIPRRFLWYESCEDEYGPGARSWRGMMRLWYILAYTYIYYDITWSYIYMAYVSASENSNVSRNLMNMMHHCITLSFTLSYFVFKRHHRDVSWAFGTPPMHSERSMTAGHLSSLRTAVQQPVFTKILLGPYVCNVLYDFISLYIYMFHWLLHDEETVFEIHLGTRPFADHSGRCDNLNQIKEIN
jgi:hypothetical protein